jgi:C4-dicarboxylate-specific signal transduction histidine kinase
VISFVFLLTRRKWVFQVGMANIKLSTLFTMVFITVISVMVMISVYYVHRSEQINDQHVQSVTNQAITQLAFSREEYLETRDRFVSLLQLVARDQNLNAYIADPNKSNRAILETV